MMVSLRWFVIAVLGPGSLRESNKGKQPRKRWNNVQLYFLFVRLSDLRDLSKHSPQTVCFWWKGGAKLSLWSGFLQPTPSKVLWRTLGISPWRGEVLYFVHIASVLPVWSDFFPPSYTKVESFLSVVSHSTIFLDCKEIKAVNPKGNQPWIFIGKLMLKLKLQYFGHLMQRTDSLEKTDVGKDWGQ